MLGVEYARVGLELVIMLPSEAERARSNAFANGSILSRFVLFWVQRRLVPVYRLWAKRELDCGCNNPGTLQAFSPDQPHYRIACGPESPGELCR